MEKEISEPAFPTNVCYNGMTLRDYFAAKAMQAMIASGTVPTGIMIDTAKESYEMADAMLEARK